MTYDQAYAIAREAGLPPRYGDGWPATPLEEEADAVLEADAQRSLSERPTNGQKRAGT